MILSRSASGKPRLIVSAQLTAEPILRHKLVQSLWQDFRYSLRTLAKNPAFSLLAVAALAIGIGANTAIFSVVNSVLLRPLPYKDPGRLVVVLHDGRLPASPADFLDWQKQAQSFQQMAAAQAGSATLTGRDKAEQLRAMQLSPNMFSLLGAQPVRGRTFQPGEDQAGGDHIAILSYQLWQRRFGGDSGIVGQTLTLNGESVIVVGIMPESFQFAPFWVTGSEIWMPLRLSQRLNDRSGRSLRIFARLKDGISLPQAQSEMDVICRRLAQQYPATNTNLSATVVPLHEKVVGNIRPTLLVLLGTVVFVLLIACSNVANLMLVRANGRQREIAVRLAIGSSRWGLIRQSLMEGLLLSLAGAAVGLALAKWGVATLTAGLPPSSLPRQQEVSIDRAVFAFALLLSIVTGIFSGLAPALRTFRADLQETLKSGGRGATGARGQHRTRSLLVIGQVALALMLLIGAGLMLRTFQHLQAVDPGFDPRNLLTMEIAAGGTAYPGGAQRIRFFEQLRPQLEALPGVESVSFINHLPVNGDIWTLGIGIAGREAPPPGQGPSAAYRVVQPGYFTTMKAPFTRGRDFSAHDGPGSTPVVIVNESLARHFWTGQDPLGKRIALDARSANPAWMTVVGVVKDIVQNDWTAKPQDEIYLPHAQSTAQQFSYMTLMLRVNGDPGQIARAVEGAVYRLDKDVPVSQVKTMEQVIGDKLWRGRLSMVLLGSFATIALALAALGIYGVISFTVSQRTNEIGVRMALGARGEDVLGMILRNGLAIVIAGLALGLLGAIALTRALTSLLYGVKPTDALTFAIVSCVLVLVSLLACAVPALRASRIDPMIALRYE